MSANTLPAVSSWQQLSDYVAMARLGYWAKNIFTGPRDGVGAGLAGPAVNDGNCGPTR